MEMAGEDGSDEQSTSLDDEELLVLRWSFFETISLVGLCALSLRVVSAMCIGLFNNVGFSGAVNGSQAIAARIQDCAGFGDAIGNLFLIGLLIFLWWRVSYWSEEYRASADLPNCETRNLVSFESMKRLEWMCGWARVLSVLDVAATVALIVAYVINFPDYFWSESVRTLGYAIAYSAFSFCGLAGSWRLCRECRNFFLDD